MGKNPQASSWDINLLPGAYGSVPFILMLAILTVFSPAREHSSKIFDVVLGVGLAYLAVYAAWIGWHSLPRKAQALVSIVNACLCIWFTALVVASPTPVPVVSMVLFITMLSGWTIATALRARHLGKAKE